MSKGINASVSGGSEIHETESESHCPNGKVKVSGWVDRLPPVKSEIPDESETKEGQIDIGKLRVSSKC